MALPLTPLSQHAFADLEVGLLSSNPHVGVLLMARPGKANAFNTAMWEGFPKAVRALEGVDTVRVIIVAGQGSNFTAGIDLGYLTGMFATLTTQHGCPARLREAFRANLLFMQDAFNALEQCKWPVIAAVHGNCVGGGVDLISACDIRICCKSARFCVKEVDLAIAADLGTLQRLPGIIGHGAVMELALTARTIDSDEALRLGLVSQVVGEDQAALLIAAVKLAELLASKSPLALIGTKRVLLNTRDHPAVGPALEYVANYNAALVMFSEDLNKVVSGKGKPTFSKL